MAKKVEIELDVKGNIVESTKNLRALKTELKNVAAGTAEWNKIKNDIRDIEDALESAGQSSEDFKGLLENAPGPLGVLGGAIKKVELATKSWGAALKATGIGLLVSLIGGLVAAFAQTEGSMKKLEPLLIGMEKIFGGLVEMAQPLLDLMLDLGLKALPYVTSAFKNVYSAVFSVLQSLGKLGQAVMKLVKGDFSGAWETAKESVTKFGENFEQNQKNFEKGAAKMTKTQKENAKATKETADAAKKAAQDRINANETLQQSEDELAEARRKKSKDEIQALKDEQVYKDKELKREKDRIDELLKTEKKGSDEYKALLSDKNKLDADYLKDKEARDKTIADKEKEKVQKQKEINEAIAAVNKALEDQKLTSQKEGLVKELNTIKKGGDDKIAAYKKQLDDLVEKQGLSIQEAAKKLKEFTDNVSQEVLNATTKVLGTDFLNKLDAGLTRFFENNKNSFDDVVKTIDNAQVKLDDAYKKGLISEADYASRSKALQNELVAAKEKNVMATQMLSDAAGQAAQAIGAETAAGIILIKVQQAAALAATGLALAESFKGLGKDIGKGFPTNLIAVASTLALIATAISQFKSLLGVSPKSLGNMSGGGSPAGNTAASMGKNYADGGLIGGLRHAQGGTLIEAEQGEAIMTRGAVTMFGPLLSNLNQMGGGTSFGNALTTRPDAASISLPAQDKSPVIMKTYVVSNELTTEAEKQARLKDLSTL